MCKNKEWQKATSMWVKISPSHLVKGCICYPRSYFTDFKQHPRNVSHGINCLLNPRFSDDFSFSSTGLCPAAADYKIIFKPNNVTLMHKHSPHQNIKLPIPVNYLKVNFLKVSWWVKPHMCMNLCLPVCLSIIPITQIIITAYMISPIWEWLVTNLRFVETVLRPQLPQNFASIHVSCTRITTQSQESPTLRWQPAFGVPDGPFHSLWFLSCAFPLAERGSWLRRPQ